MRQNYTLYGAVPAAINLRRIKVYIIQLFNYVLSINNIQVKNGRLASCEMGEGDMFV